MVGSSRPVSQLNPLLKISVRVEHYVELSTKDNFDTDVFQSRLKQHFNTPWREPKSPMKTRLCVTYTSLILTSASWWPYRQQRCLDFEHVQRFLTFYQAGRYCAIGMQDKDLAEKQFVVLLTKSIGDLDQLLRLMQSQLSVWKKFDLDSLPDRRPVSIVPTGLPTLKAQSTTSTREHLYNGNNMHSTSDPFVIRGFDGKQRIDGPTDDVKYCSTVMLRACDCKTTHLNRIKVASSQEEEGVRKEGKSKKKHYFTRHQLPMLHEEGPLSKSGVSIVHEEAEVPSKRMPMLHSGSKVAIPSTSYTVVDQSKDLTPKISCRDPTAWEVDIKYVRYDPVLGNVLDDQGSVYLYTAHQINR